MAQSGSTKPQRTPQSLQHRLSLVDDETKDYSLSRMKLMYKYPAAS